VGWVIGCVFWKHDRLHWAVAAAGLRGRLGILGQLFSWLTERWGCEGSLFIQVWMHVPELNGVLAGADLGDDWLAIGGHETCYFVLGKDLQWLPQPGDFDADDAVSVDAHEVHVLGRMAVDPFFKWGLIFEFAGLGLWLTQSVEDHLGAHADHHVVVEDCLFEVGAYRCRPAPGFSHRRR